MAARALFAYVVSVALTAGWVPAVAAGAWSAPQDLPAARPHDLFDGLAGLAMASDGTAIALTDAGAADPGRAVSVEQPPDEPWAPPVTLGPGRPGELAAAGDGTALAVWASRRFLAPTFDVLAARRGADGSWSPPETVESAVAGDGFVRDVTVNAGGEAIASVQQGPDSASAVFARRPTGVWAPLDPAPAAPWAHFLIQDSGAVLAVWRGDAPDGSAGQGPVTVAARPAGGGAVFAPFAPPAGSPTVFQLELSGSPAGDALIVGDDVSRGFRSPDQRFGEIVAVRPANGALSPTSVFPGVGITGAMGADGTAVAAWRDHPAGAPRATIRAVLRDPGGAIGTPVVLGTVPGASEASGPVVGVGPDGTAVVAWSWRRAGRPGAVWASVRRPGGRFRPATLVNDRLLPAVVDRAAADRAGSAVVSWTESTGKAYVVQAARAEPAPLVRGLGARLRGRDIAVVVRLGAPARVVLRLVSARGGALARVTRSLTAGVTTVRLRLRARPPAGRLRVHALATAAAQRTAGASAPVVRPPG